MNWFKKILIGICALVVLLGMGIVVLAFQPNLSDSLAQRLYGGEAQETTQTDENGNDTSATEDDSAELPTEASANQTNDSNTESTSQETETGDQESSDTSGNPQENNAGQNAFDGIVVSMEPENIYTQPEEETIQAPSNVSGKFGYTPIQGDEEQIEDSQTQTDVGETGDGLSFDTELYPYYGMLDESLQHLYRQIYANAVALNPTFGPVEEISFQHLKTVFEAVYNDHPELFWLETEYSCKYLKTGQCVEITLQFNETADNLEKAQTAFENAAEGILESARNQSSIYDQEKTVHNALLEHADYNLASLMNQSAYSAMVSGETVCAGYARAFQYLMLQLGIPCYYCTGYAGQNHAWNIIKLEDVYYNVDVTWDDTDPASYDYFNKTDADYVQTHRRTGLSMYLPACGGETYRNLEKGTPQIPGQETTETEETTDNSKSGLHSLADFNLTEEDVLKDMDSYYQECYNYLINTGFGTVEFQCVIPEALWDSLENAYATRAYEKGYVNKALETLGGSSCRFQIDGEELQGGFYLLNHIVNIAK